MPKYNLLNVYSLWCYFYTLTALIICPWTTSMCALPMCFVTQKVSGWGDGSADKNSYFIIKDQSLDPNIHVTSRSWNTDL